MFQTLSRVLVVSLMVAASLVLKVPGVNVARVHADTNLGGLDLNAYCHSLGYVGVSLDGSTAFDWHCVTRSGSKVGMDLTAACRQQYGRADAYAQYGSANDPYSWACYAPNSPPGPRQPPPSCPPPGDMPLTKVSSRPSIGFGQTETWTVTATNYACFAASVSVTDSVPNAFGSVSAGGVGWSCSMSGNNVSCSLASLSPLGSSSPLTIKATANGCGSVTNAADASFAAVGSSQVNFGHGSSTVMIDCDGGGGAAKKVIVFLRGVCTQVDDDTFDNVKTLLRAKGYTDAQFLSYSYAGGRINDDGTWQPNSYSRSAAIQQNFQTTSLQALHEQLLLPYHARHPNTTFVLVGHSLGGMVALEEVVRHVKLISAVITVDSPLHGVVPSEVAAGSSLSAFLPSLDCVVDGSAASILAGLHNNDDVTHGFATTEALVNNINYASTLGVMVTTAGNLSDCVWNPSLCNVPIAGDTSTQFVANSAAFVRAFNIPQPCLTADATCFIGTHGAALKIAPDAIRAIADNIGPQN